MNLNASKTKTMIVSRSRKLHHQSPPLTIGRTALKESRDLGIFGVTFVSLMTFGKHFRSGFLSILSKAWYLVKVPASS